jgi:hypothetical protein
MGVPARNAGSRGACARGFFVFFNTFSNDPLPRGEGGPKGRVRETGQALDPLSRSERRKALNPLSLWDRSKTLTPLSLWERGRGEGGFLRRLLAAVLATISLSAHAVTAPVGATPGSFAVNEHGGATYTVPPHDASRYRRSGPRMQDHR